MRFFITFLILFFVGNLNLQEVPKKEKKKKSTSPPPTSYIALPKENLKIIYNSWILEEVSFPSELPIETNEIKPPLENLIKNPPKKLEKKSSNFIKFFSENQKIILVGLAIVLFAIYQFRKTGIDSSSKVAKRTFSKFKNK